jgi:integrase/recombinase XerC
MINLTPSEFKRMLAAIDLKAPMGPRDYLLLVFDYNTGLRVGELCSLNVSNVARNGVPRQSLHVRASVAKNGQGRLVPLNSLAQKAIAKLLAFNRARGFSVADDAPLFATKKHQRLSVRTVEWVVEQLRNKAGIDFQATPHSLRHSFASLLVQRTGNLRAVQALDGLSYCTSLTRIDTCPQLWVLPSPTTRWRRSTSCSKPAR